jgi:methionine synthase II (cobalamin-independent)
VAGSVLSVTDWPWPPGAATGIGSLPGTDVVEAVDIVFGELPDFPHLPELPDRGPGADLVGRGAALLVELPVELYANRWRVAARPGHDLRVARDLWQRDLDTVTERAAGYTGPFKVQVAGPYTLAASVELATGGPLLRDHGAVRELVASLAEGVRGLTAELAGRLPGASLVVQVDEPSLPAALAGTVPTESGLYTLRRVEPADARTALASIVDAAGVPVIVHSCAPSVPVTLLREAGAAAIAVDLSLLGDLDPLGEALDAGVGLVAGVSAPSPADAATKVRDVWRILGFPADRRSEQVVVSPACGLAGLSVPAARAAMTTAREAARRLREE